MPLLPPPTPLRAPLLPPPTPPPLPLKLLPALPLLLRALPTLPRTLLLPLRTLPRRCNLRRLAKFRIGRSNFGSGALFFFRLAAWMAPIRARLSATVCVNSVPIGDKACRNRR